MFFFVGLVAGTLGITGCEKSELPKLNTTLVRDSITPLGISPDSLVLINTSAKQGELVTVHFFSNAFKELVAGQFRMVIGSIQVTPTLVQKTLVANSKAKYILTFPASHVPGNYSITLKIIQTGYSLDRKSPTNLWIIPAVKKMYVKLVNLIALNPNSFSVAESGNIQLRLFDGSVILASSTVQSRSWNPSTGWSPSAYTWTISPSQEINHSSPVYVQFLLSGVMRKQLEMTLSTFTESDIYGEFQSSVNFSSPYDFKVGTTFEWK